MISGNYFSIESMSKLSPLVFAIGKCGLIFLGGNTYLGNYFWRPIKLNLCWISLSKCWLLAYFLLMWETSFYFIDFESGKLIEGWSNTARSLISFTLCSSDFLGFMFLFISLKLNTYNDFLFLAILLLLVVILFSSSNFSLFYAMLFLIFFFELSEFTSSSS